MTKLSKYLDNIRRGGQAFGFATRQAERPASLALVAVLAEPDPAAVSAALQAGADGVVFAFASATVLAEGGEAVKALVAAAGDKPRGLLLSAAAAEGGTDAKAWADWGLDFVVLTEDQPAALLLGETEKVVRVGVDFDPMDVRAFDAVGADAFLLAAPAAQGNTRLSVKSLARYRLLIGLTNKPVLIAVANGVVTSDLELFAQIGAEGIVLETGVTGRKPEQVKAAIGKFRQAITKLGPRKPPKRRARSETPIIPRSAMQAGEGDEEPDEPELPD
ncbi:MAG: hypothetical protein ACYC3S_09450 [Chloroflexota bacterium]